MPVATIKIDQKKRSRLKSIATKNGKTVDALVDELMSKIHGDTYSLKELVMQFRRERDKYLAV